LRREEERRREKKRKEEKERITHFGVIENESESMSIEPFASLAAYVIPTSTTVVNPARHGAARAANHRRCIRSHKV
jgi:hypothetical protein